MPKWLKMILALVLLPVCYGAAVALWRMVLATGKADTVWVAFGSGAACWLVDLSPVAKAHVDLCVWP